ncbi:putative transcription factor interactor and regulator CCHC(Zn) family [Helianthus annuus]|nr:putative transcription factor interactor and regulator CCHC(Zn) family [Helianthus annuus]
MYLPAICSIPRYSIHNIHFSFLLSIFLYNTHTNRNMTTMTITASANIDDDVSDMMMTTSAVRMSNIVVSEPRWEIDEDRSILYDFGHIRMKNKNRGYGDGQESNPDRTISRSRMFARMKRNILMKLEIEIELLEREPEWFNVHGNEGMKQQEMFNVHKNREKEREPEWLEIAELHVPGKRRMIKRNERRRKDLTKKRCYYCHDMGHLIAFCKLKEHDNATGIQRTRAEYDVTGTEHGLWADIWNECCHRINKSRGVRRKRKKKKMQTMDEGPVHEEQSVDEGPVHEERTMDEANKSVLKHSLKLN